MSSFTSFVPAHTNLCSVIEVFFWRSLGIIFTSATKFLSFNYVYLTKQGNHFFNRNLMHKNLVLLERKVTKQAIGETYFLQICTGDGRTFNILKRSILPFPLLRRNIDLRLKVLPFLPAGTTQFGFFYELHAIQVCCNFNI